MQRIKLSMLVSVAVIMTMLVLLRTDLVNGPYYWKWQPRRLSPWPLYGGMALATVPVLAAQFVNRRRWPGTALALALLVLGCFAMKVNMALSRTDRGGLNFIRDVVMNPQITGYYADAVEVSGQSLGQWMAAFPQRMPNLTMHAMSKPPGPILYWFIWIKLLGPGDRTAIVGGLMLGLLAALGIAATYLFLRHLLDDEPAAFAGASFMALCPGFVLFFPMLDPAYVLLSTAMIGSWSLALRTDRARYAIFTGLLTGLSLLIAFNVLVAGIFMIGLIGRRVRIAVRQALFAAVTMIATLIALRLVIRYDVIGTFAMAWANQHQLLAWHANERPYPATILFDLTDFALGVGWIGFLLVLFYFLQPDSSRNRWLAILGVGQILIVAMTGLLQSETARVWNFMLPLLMIPIGLELARWRRESRLVCYVALAILTTVIYQRMTFLL